MGGHALSFERTLPRLTLLSPRRRVEPPDHHHEIRTMRHLNLWLACFLFVLPHTVFAETPYRATHGATPQQFQDWINGVAKDNFIPVSLGAYNDGDQPRFTAVAVKNTNNVAWQVRSQLSDAAYSKLFGELTQDGFRPTQLAANREGGQLRFACLFVKGDGEKRAWQAQHNLSSEGFQKAFAAHRAAGRQPVQVVGYANEQGGHSLAGIFLTDDVTTSITHHDLTDAQYQQVITDYAPQGYRPFSLSVYPTANGSRFALVMVKDETAWKARHGLTSEAYQQAFNEYTSAGFRPQSVIGYPTADGVLFAAVWVKD